VAATLNNLGVTALYHGDLEEAGVYFARALRIHERHAPNSLSVAQTLGNLALVTFHRGDLPAAEESFRRSLAIKQSIASDSLAVATDLRNLGFVAYRRGDLSSASAYFTQVVDIMERHAPNTMRLANNLNNLGAVAETRGDTALAESLFERALAIQEEIAPDRLGVASTLGNLALLALDNGDLGVAESYFRRVLAIQEELAPDSLGVALTLDNLGRVAAGNEDWQQAEDCYRQALEIRQRQAPRSLALASSFANLGALARQRGALVVAEEHYRRALAIRQRLAPGSMEEATSLHDIGVMLRDRDQPDDALEFFARAVVALEAQEGRLGTGGEGRSVFRARHMGMFRDYLETLLEAGRPDEAFHVLERSRAQALLAMLAERDLLFTADIPPELERERRAAAAEADRVFAALAGLSFAEPAEGERGVGGLAPASSEARRQELLGELHAIRRRQEEIRARVRAASPRLAALTSPQPLDLQGTMAMLEAGTVLLSYSLAEESCHLFAVDANRGSLEVHTLETDQTRLRQQVKMLRTLIRQPASARDELSGLAAALYQTLLAPAGAAIADANRLVVVPDGPLHLLPFAVLRNPSLTTGKRLVIETAPLSVVASATVLAELKRTRRPQRQDRVVGFADPLYPPKSANSAPESEWLTGIGLDLRSLPGARREVERLRELFGPSTRVWLGADVTEERVKSTDQDVTIVHLAAHALVNEQLPLESALALTIPESLEEDRDNGLLQVWEVFETVRLDADLVTLSACETALGKEVTGEGIVGLTRAFQYAGARSVLASLWNVSDASTAELMDRFYRHLEAGSSKDQALRQAQLELIHGPIALSDKHGHAAASDASHPYHWAAFVLVGDWQ
jgi:CHAT domain-containing protein/Tfp pilus assembly protein PilF